MSMVERSSFLGSGIFSRRCSCRQVKVAKFLGQERKRIYYEIYRIVRIANDCPKRDKQKRERVGLSASTMDPGPKA